MRILVLTPVYPHASSPTEGLFIAQHSRALTAKGAEIVALVPKPWLPEPLARIWKRYRALSCLPGRERRGPIEILYPRYLQVPQHRWPHRTTASCARAILTVLRRHGLGSGLDLIQAHSAWPVGLAAPEVAESLGIPFVVTAHIRDDERLSRSAEGSRLYRRMLRRAASLVAVGSPLVRFLEGFGESRSVFRIPNGADLEESRRIAAAVVDSGDEEGGRVVSVSSLWPVKGIDYNLKALAELDRRGVPWRSYTVVGDGPERGGLEALARKLGIAERVEFTGWLRHRAALERIAEADVFSLPSWQEAFGVVYVEAMACGKPVIGCRGQGAEDIVRHGVEGFLVEPRSVASLAKALETSIVDEALTRSLGTAAARRAGEFTWERNVARYLELYEGILRRGRSI